MRVVAVVPAYNSDASVGQAVSALLSDTRVVEVIVVDDASRDSTVTRSREAGARVVPLPRNVGKGAVLERGFREAAGADVIVTVDADTGESAAAVLDLIDPVSSGVADLVVGVLPAAGRLGGFGLVRDTAARLIRMGTGFESRAPISGQRALRPEVLEVARPLAAGFGVDAAMTFAAALEGLRILEVPIEMTHQHRGRTLGGFRHRARQGWDILKALVPRVLRNRSRPRPDPPG
jgi:hypothetical protein